MARTFRILPRDARALAWTLAAVAMATGFVAGKADAAASDPNTVTITMGSFSVPPNKEVFMLPPTDDPRYSSYPSFPKGTLNQEYVKRDKEREESGPGSTPKGMPRFGSPGGNGGGLGSGY